MAKSEGEVALGLNLQATARMLVVAFFVGGAVATALFAALNNSFQLSQAYPKDISTNGPYWGLFFKLGLLIAAVSFAIVKLRQPRGARINWSDWGADGAIEMFSYTGEAAGVLPGKNSPVLGLATEWSTLAVADKAGITLWDVRAKQSRVALAQKDVTGIAFGTYPDLLHQTRNALLVLTADGSMNAVDDSGTVKRRFPMHLPRGEQPVCVYTNPREVLIGTDHGALYQLWIR